jgi:hypothetical protein
MSWQYLGDHWWEVAYWHFRSWACDTLRVGCPSCVERDRKDAAMGEAWKLDQ